MTPIFREVVALAGAPDGQLDARHLDLGDRGIYHLGNRLNDLTGREWVFATRTVWNKAYPPSFQHELRSRHGGQKPPELCAELISTFTKANMCVLDPFMGVGGTLLGATLSGRRATGIEVNPEWAGIYQQVCQGEGLEPQQVLVGDSRVVLRELPTQSYDFLLTDVPYWDMDVRRRSTGKFKRAGGAAQERRSSRLAPFAAAGLPTSRAEWLNLLAAVFDQCRRLLRPKAYVAVFIGDMYHSGEYHPLSHHVTAMLQGLGYTMKANLIWYDVSKRLNVYGYRYEFIPSLTHQNILIFRHRP